MLYIILLLILAVALFGASAVLGALGYVLGFITIAAALTFAAIIFSLDPLAIAAIALVGFFVLCGLVMLVAKLLEPWELERIKRRDLNR